MPSTTKVGQLNIIQSGMENGNLWYNPKYKKSCEKKVTSMKKNYYCLLKQWGEYIITYR